MIRYEGRYVDSLLIYVHPLCALEASDMNFQTIWIPKGILAKKFLDSKTVTRFFIYEITKNHSFLYLFHASSCGINFIWVIFCTNAI